MKTRSAFTLIELLATLSIISLMVALLLPAIQNVRAAASKANCQNKLRQIGIATHQYETTFGKLPPAFRHRGNGVAQPHLQWPILITEYLEQTASARQADEDYAKSKDVFLPSPHRGVSTPVRAFACPDDPRLAEAWELSFTYTIAQPKPIPLTVKIALNSYLGVAGAYAARKDGCIVADGAIRITDILDGTSQTLMFGERPPPESLVFGWLYVGWGSNAKGYGELASVLGVADTNPYLSIKPTPACGPGPFPFQEPNPDDSKNCSMFQFWSPHAGGANFVYADGSVHFLRYGCDATLKQMATRAGGEVVTELP
jgi:prepilin-type N-terminal cleavage/methylation domain-containing protein/prepilin-type processing-associated H-X9-DG protein